MPGWRASLLLFLLLVPLATAMRAPATPLTGAGRTAAGDRACGMSCCRPAAPGAACPTRGVCWLRGVPGRRAAATATAFPEVVQPPATILRSPQARAAAWCAAASALPPAIARLPYRPPRPSGA
jgi:hypothetical protein